MRASDPDPMKRWKEIADFYIEFASKENWEFLFPMIVLAEWVAKQPYAARLYPGTSHECLTVSLVPGYQPDLPFFSCLSLADGTSSCELWAAVGESRGEKSYPLQQIEKGFTEFVNRLDTIAVETKKETM